MPLTTNLELKLSINHTVSKDLSTPEDKFQQSVVDVLSSGTGLDNADLVFHDSRTLAATSEDLDLAASLSDSFGNTLTFVKVKGIFIKNTSTTAGDILSVGGAAANQFINWVGNSSDIINIGPDGVLFLWDPSLAAYAVTAGTGDLLKIDAGGNTITYEIIIIGTDA